MVLGGWYYIYFSMESHIFKGFLCEFGFLVYLCAIVYRSCEVYGVIGSSEWWYLDEIVLLGAKEEYMVDMESMCLFFFYAGSFMLIFVCLFC